MARRPFGGNFEVVDSNGTQLVGVTGFAYDAESGGTLLTDLTDPGGTPLSGGQLTTTTNGKVEWQGTDDLRDSMWIDFGNGRFLVFATDYTTRLSTLETTVLQIATLAATVSSFDARVTAVENKMPTLDSDHAAVTVLQTQIGGTLAVAVWNGVSYPTRPLTAQPVLWVGPDITKPTIGSPYAADGVDLFLGYT